MRGVGQSPAVMRCITSCSRGLNGTERDRALKGMKRKEKEEEVYKRRREAYSRLGKREPSQEFSGYEWLLPMSQSGNE